jgi:hypothetical protein
VVLFTKQYYGDEIEEDEIDGALERIRDMRIAYNILVGKSEGKYCLGVLCVGENNIKMDLK